MPEDMKKGDAGAGDVLAKIERLESLLKETENARRQGAMIARLSVLVILVAFGAFAWNLWGFYKSFTSPSNMEKLKEQVVADMKDIMQGPEIKIIEKKIMNETVPKVTEIFIARFKKELPMLKDKGQAFLGGMKDYVETHLKEEMTKALEESMKGVEEDLLKKFPQVTPERLQETLAAAQYVFIEDITDELERSLVDLSSMFDDLDKVIAGYRETPEYKALSEKELDDVKLELAEALLELAIYEVNPPRGEKTQEGGSK